MSRRSTELSPGGPSGGRKSEAFHEEITLPESSGARERSLTPAEAKDAFLHLFSSGVDEPDSGTTPFRDTDAIVRGFCDGIRLFRHQVAARAWMRDREDLSKRRAGGLLADDMGVGKAIELVARAVDDSYTILDLQLEEGCVKATLVVCPLSVMPQWVAEIKKFVSDVEVVAAFVVTTYDIVRSEHSHWDPEHPAVGSPLFTTRWRRIALDEAHKIKTRSTKTAVACCDLRATFRWCLTATPIQNEVADFFSLLKFLRIKPLNDWERYNLQIAKPILKGTGANLAMRRIQVVLNHIMLRRTKVQLNSVLKLPERHVALVPCAFDQAEREFYTALKTNAMALLKRIRAKQALEGGNIYMNVLVLLLRLRQACDHPFLLLKSCEGDVDDISPDIVPSMLRDDDTEDEDDDGGLKCQLCFTRLTRRNTAAKDWSDHCIDCAALKVQSENLIRNPRRSSAKIRKIAELLRRIHEESDGQEKTVIFSQFTSMLDIIEPFLMALGIGYVRYDGSMSADERQRALEDIAKDARMNVILVSLKAGGVGLNLTACSRVILVDMWWNPAVEEQAFDRTHRVGQTRNVSIYKLKIHDTVEDRILELQEKKRELARVALSGDQIKNMKLGMNELLTLFK
ncbi:P-loop containing nucleoside triphosphate hydrolase protein [Roridomyces roridus]|uniref:P-loop containing nucleoside triphosphate hydrolase protein n=1 Tax=Roridomyces roridus TaxID=1738132 RepID=A0AAD7C273_9AGAR|nr:P-loop containing nucleoside triphosphate hydrolase protein [Roridomyces roridus]